MQNIVIKHLSGARANQVDEFPASGIRELIAGRDGAANVRFNPDRDDLVSRQHLKIAADPNDPDMFQLIDLQSRNGTFLNQKRIYGTVRLNHGDVIQLGAGGPEFRFELSPPPPAGPARPTREASVSETLAGVQMKPTRDSWLPSPDQPRPVGRATVERMLGDVFTRVKRESNRSLWVGVMVLVAILAVGAVVWLYLRQTQVEQAAAQQENLNSLRQVNEELKRNPAAANALRQQIANLEAQLHQADQRNQASAKALLEEVKSRLEQANADRLAAAASAAQAAPAQPNLQPAAVQPNTLAPVPPPETPHQVAPPPPPAQPKQASAVTNQTYDALMEQATEQYQRGQSKAALDLVNAAIAKDGSRWESYQFAGQLAGVLNDYTLATAMLQKALVLAPADYHRDLQYMLDDVKEKMVQK